MGQLDGKVAVVLGASAKKGTGWAIAEKFAAEGAKVVVGARSFAPLQELAQKIGGEAVACDAGNEAQVQALIKHAVKRFGRLDVALNAAGLPMLGNIADAKIEALQDAARVNYFGNVFFIKYAAEAMTKGGSITLISSLSTTHPVEPHFAYACTKAAADCLVRYAALEYGPRGIRVNSILPGGIVSELTSELFSVPGAREAFEREIPLRRLGYPEDFANAALWLAGPAYVTGLNLEVCGGNQLTRFVRPSELPGGSDSYGSGKPLFDRN